MKVNGAPEPPDFLTEPARNAFFRIHHFLESRGLYDDICRSLLAVAAMTCCRYLEHKKYGLPSAHIEDTRIQARKLLAEFCYIPESRIHLAVINPDGLDSDIVAVCDPF